MACDQFQISELGFLPSSCCQELPTVFSYLQEILDNLSTSDGLFFREITNKINIKQSKEEYRSQISSLTIVEKRFMYSVFAMSSNKYIWCCGPDSMISKIPSFIGIPWFYVSEDLGLPIVVTHAALDLYNWSLIDPSQPFSLDNLKSNYLITGTPTEEWFYLSMVAIEGVSGDALNSIMKINDELNSKQNNCDLVYIRDQLRTILGCIFEMNKIIQRLPEKCDPEFFFKKLRIYLSGSADKKFFPNGLEIENFSLETPVSYLGGSAAQSSLIQAYDIFFGVEHLNEEHSRPFLTSMRKYMPAIHNDFLKHLESSQKIYDTQSIMKNTELQSLYAECVKQLKIFRQHHYKIVHTYVLKFVHEADKSNVHGGKGSGGTVIEKMLPDLIQDTQNTFVRAQQYHVSEQVNFSETASRSNPFLDITRAEQETNVIAAESSWWRTLWYNNEGLIYASIFVTIGAFFFSSFVN